MMRNTFQFQNQNIIQHGKSVNHYFKQIVTALNQKDYSKFKLPDLLIQNWDKIQKYLYHKDILLQYHVYHDCGKPYCKTIDDKGRQHFHGHAQKSYEIYSSIFGEGVVAKLIQSDMIFHSGTIEQIQDFISSNDDKRFLWSLYTTSLAELYSNSAMFNADNQSSFNKKYAKLETIIGMLPL